MNIASIDIGSNGARLLIKSFDDNAPAASRIKKLLFVRIPLRLGKDVFALGKISKERQRMMMHMMNGFRQFMLLYNVEHFRACATSAMRDAENGKKVMRRIEKETGIKLEIIPGAGILCLCRRRWWLYGDIAFARRSACREPLVQYRNAAYACWCSYT